MAIIHGNEENFDSLINGELVLVDFYASWCGPCKMLSPVLDNLASDRGIVKIVKIDIDENRNLTKQFGVMSVPTLLLFKNGKVVSNHIGFMDKNSLTNWINEYK